MVDNAPVGWAGGLETTGPGRRAGRVGGGFGLINGKGGGGERSGGKGGGDVGL